MAIYNFLVLVWGLRQKIMRREDYNKYIYLYFGGDKWRWEDFYFLRRRSFSFHERTFCILSFWSWRQSIFRWESSEHWCTFLVLERIVFHYLGIFLSGEGWKFWLRSSGTSRGSTFRFHLSCLVSGRFLVLRWFLKV